MNLHFPTLIPALLVGFLGGYVGSISGFYPDSTDTSTASKKISLNKNTLNPFRSSQSIDDAEYQFEALHLKIEGLQIQIETLQKQQDQSEHNASPETISTAKKPSSRGFSRGSPYKENLITAGMNPDVADDILRRLSQQEFRRLELQNLMQRSNSAQRRQYSKELRELNKNKISLRTEMGDDSYDQYLYVSGQNNRVKVSSVMAGSPAEASGFQADDIILSYDTQKILTWPDIRAATIQGEIGSYTNIEILRDGERLNLTVPRGTLGVQLDAVIIKP